MTSDCDESVAMVTPVLSDDHPRGALRDLSRHVTDDVTHGTCDVNSDVTRDQRLVCFPSELFRSAFLLHEVALSK